MSVVGMEVVTAETLDGYGEQGHPCAGRIENWRPTAVSIHPDLHLRHTRAWPVRELRCRHWASRLRSEAGVVLSRTKSTRAAANFRGTAASSTSPETISIRRQCGLLDLARSALYYEALEVTSEELALMRRIDAIYLEHPYYGSRRMTVVLGKEGQDINRKRVQRLMRILGLEGMAPGPHTSRPHPEHLVFPYLLRGLAVVRPDQVWATGATGR